MGLRTRALTLGTAGTVAVVGLLAAGSASAHAGGVLAPLESSGGGTQYGMALAKAKPMRPVASTFTVAPRVLRSPALPTITVRVDQPGADTVRARLVLMPQTEPGTIVRVDLGTLRAGKRTKVAWPKGVELPPGKYVVRLHVKGLGDAVLARTARATGKTSLTVRAPVVAPAAAPVPDATGHVFPVAGAHTYGDGFGVARPGWAHQGVDLMAASGVPVVAPVAGSISFVDYQASAAGYYVVERGADGYDYFFAHCSEGSIVVSETQTVVAGQQLCSVGATGSATAPHLHFEMWEHGWRASAASRPIDPLPFLRAWDGLGPA